MTNNQSQHFKSINNTKPNSYYISKLIKLYFNGKLRAKYNIEKNRSQQNYSPQATEFSRPMTGKTNKISHEIDNYLATKSEAEQRASFLRLLIDEVEEALESLVSENELENGRTEKIYDDYNLLKWSYQRVPNYSDEEVAEKLNIHRNTAINKRNSIFEELSRLINVDYYIKNPIEDIAMFFRELINE